VLKALYRLLRLSPVFAPLYRWSRLSKIDWPSPIAAPLSITRNLMLALQDKGDLRLYDWREHAVCQLNQDDIMLFHPRTIMRGEYNAAPDYSTIGLRSLKENGVGKKYIIMPYNHDPRQVAWLKSVLSEDGVDGFIAITGRYWADSWSQSPLFGYINVKDVCFVSMAIDSAQYPFLKTNFNLPGKRKFLYIGKSGAVKNTAQLENIAMRYPGFCGGYISPGQIQGWKKIANFMNLTADVMQDLAREYDIFINVSPYDAQATTVLEQMCFGLPIACTPGSGYNYPSIIPLDPHDTEFNCRQIEIIQNMPAEALKNLSLTNRNIAEKEHNWDLFNNKIINFIKV